MPATSKPAAAEQGSAEQSPAEQGSAAPHAAVRPTPSAQQPEPSPIRLRPLTPADLPLLSQWFSAAHVERWWHESSDLAEIRSEYLPSIEGSEPSHVLIAELPAGPFGLAQWYRWSDYPDHAHSLGADPDEAGFDYLIGSPDLCGRGIGTRLITALVKHIRERDATVAGFVVDPEVANAASRRILEKNGFELIAVKEIPDPDGHPIGPTAIYRRRLASGQPARSVCNLGGP
ncbi:MAG: GNAT family N-acetyltransferase [Jatrophihabitantaceae bacterium]